MRQLRPIVFQLSSMVCLSVHLSVTVVSPAKTAQPIEMQPESLTPFGLRTRVAKGTMYLMVQIPHGKGQFWGGGGAAHCIVWEHSAVNCAKMAELIEMPFGFRIRVGPRKHVLGGVHTGATWRIQFNRLCGGYAAFLSNYFGHLLYYLSNSLSIMIVMW